MTRVGALLAVALTGGCSSLEPNSDGIAALEIRPPLCNGIELGQTVSLTAVPLDEHGEPIEAPVRWQTPDDSAIDVDSLAGEITGLRVSDTARVQVRGGTEDPVISDFIPFVVTPLADTLVQNGVARDTLEPNVAASPALLVTLRKASSDSAVKSFPVHYRIAEPVFATVEDRTVELPGGRISTTTCSTSAGTPAAPITLSRREGRTAPDSAIVEVTAHHPDGSAVPGSGHRFIIVFLKP